MASRTVSVELRAKVDNYVSGMKKASAATKSAMDTAEKNRKEMALMGKVGAVVGAAVAVQFARKIITAASDLNETVSKSTVVFGKNAAAVQAWAKTSAKAFGMSENAALGAASTYGNLFVSLGLTEDASAKMSTKLVELAGDLASFNNVSPEEALDALRSGLVGETEPLKRFGVNMNEATLKAQAMKMGLISTTKEALDPAVKAQAAYALILEQSTTAQGDFARTSDGLANQQRIMNAEWENAQAALGQTLLPAMTKAVSVLNDLLSAFNGLPQPVKSVVLGVAAVSAALIVLMPRIAATRAAMIELGLTSKITGARLSSFGKFAGIATAALVAMNIAVGKINEAAAEAVPGVDMLTKGLSDLARTGSGVLTDASDETISFADALGRLTDPSVTDRLNDFWGFVGSGGDAGPELVAMRKYIENIDTALANMVNSGHADDAAAAFALMAKDAEAQGRSIDDVKALLPGYTAAVAGAGAASSTAADGVAEVGASADGAKKEVDDLKTALDKLRGVAQSVDEANAALEQSFDDAATAAKDMKGGVDKSRTALDLNTQAGRDGQAALGGIADAAYDAAEAMGAAGVSTKTIRDRTMDARIAFIKTATEMGLTKDAAKALADKYGLIPQKVATRVAVNKAEALAAVEAVKSAIRSIPSVKNVKVQVNSQGTTQGTGGGRTVFASGGAVRGPGSGTSDSIPARLSNGEYVVKARSVRKYGTRMLGAINEGRYASGGLVRGFASGGYASTGTTGLASAGTVLAFENASRPIVLRVDSTQVWQGLLALKRGNGGASLGLG